MSAAGSMQRPTLLPTYPIDADALPGISYKNQGDNQ